MRCSCLYVLLATNLLIIAAQAPAAEEKNIASGPATKLITSFEGKNPFDGGKIVTEHAADGAHALLLDKGFIAINRPQDWSGYDYLKIDLYADSDSPVTLRIELQDRQSAGYWTRVNYSTLIPPGQSTFVLPLAQLYVGEKARPGRSLLLDGITRFVLGGDNTPLYIDNVRLERDTDTQTKVFDGLHAFSLGPKNGPLMPGYTRIDPTTAYSKVRGYGLNHAYIWRPVDSLQPEPLYENCLCIQGGGLAVDLPNGRYHVFVNIDNPSFFWGEYQTYGDRKILAQGKPVVHETMNFESLKAKYYRHWDTEDLPTDDTFDKYQLTYFHEKEFDVDVTNGQLTLDFQGDTPWACSVSAVVIYPESMAAQGKAFLDYTQQKRRFFFNNYFHRILHKPTGNALAPSPADTQRGYILFNRETMQDLYFNDTPARSEIGQPAHAAAFQGQYEPMTLGVYPLIDLGKTTATISDLSGPGVIPASDISVGYVSYRITRVAADGSVYSIEPRYILPRDTVAIGKDIARRFWFTVHVPAHAKPGLYKGQVTLTPEHGEKSTTPVEFQVYPGTLDPVDIPAGPFSYEIRAPWNDNDPSAREFDSAMDERCLKKMHDYGFTTFSGMPYVRYLGFKDGKPTFDFSKADHQMKLARDCGFTMPVITYCGFGGLDVYHPDLAAMKAAGFDDYTKFIKVVFGAIQAHADANNWLPVYWYLCDEPVGDDVAKAAANAEYYHAAFGNGPPWFTGATSVESSRGESDPHFRLARAMSVPSLNLHDEPSIRALQKAGGGWAFYNGGNRWTYGIYMFKAVKEFDMKYRLTWHWNAAAGDPYYALDCREDDYAWCSGSPTGELIPSVRFERDMRSGIDDYRCMLTLSRLAKEKHDEAAQKLIDERLASFKLGQRDHDKIFPIGDWEQFRTKMSQEIVRLRP